MKWHPQTCVVPVDFSPESMAAVDMAVDIVGAASGVHVIHVLPILMVNEPGVVWDAIDDDERRRHAGEVLAERLADERYEGIDILVTVGDAGEEVITFAEKIEADLIVLPSHGRTGIKRLLIGSVAERVVRLAHCPVLVLKPK